jgi:hypothetical protein
MSTLLLLTHVVLVLTTPALVGEVVSRAAALATRPRGVSIPHLSRARRLRLATLGALSLCAGWVTLDPSILSEERRLPLAMAELAAFVVLGLLFLFPALNEASTTARNLVRPEAGSTGIRTASLRPRRVSDYVPLKALLLPYGVAAAGATLLLLRLGAPHAGGRRPLLSIGFAGAGLVLACLYGAWIHEEACGPDPSGSPGATGEGERRRRVRAVFAGQCTLVTVLGGLSLGLVNTDWSLASGRTVALAGGSLGGLVGILGCAAVLASDVSRRRLEITVREVAR